jgi:hypothetical protein
LFSLVSISEYLIIFVIKSGRKLTNGASIISFCSWGPHGRRVNTTYCFCFLFQNQSDCIKDFAGNLSFLSLSQLESTENTDHYFIQNLSVYNRNTRLLS